MQNLANPPEFLQIVKFNGMLHMYLHPHFEWSVACHKDIKSKIKLFTSDEEWTLDVARNDIRLSERRLERQFRVCGPFSQLVELVH